MAFLRLVVVSVVDNWTLLALICRWRADCCLLVGGICREWRILSGHIPIELFVILVKAVKVSFYRNLGDSTIFKVVLAGACLPFRGTYKAEEFLHPFVVVA